MSKTRDVLPIGSTTFLRLQQSSDDQSRHVFFVFVFMFFKPVRTFGALQPRGFTVTLDRRRSNFSLYECFVLKWEQSETLNFYLCSTERKRKHRPLKCPSGRWCASLRLPPPCFPKWPCDNGCRSSSFCPCPRPARSGGGTSRRRPAQARCNGPTSRSSVLSWSSRQRLLLLLVIGHKRQKPHQSSREDKNSIAFSSRFSEPRNYEQRRKFEKANLLCFTNSDCLT